MWGRKEAQICRGPGPSGHCRWTKDAVADSFPLGFACFGCSYVCSGSRFGAEYRWDSDLFACLVVVQRWSLLEYFFFFVCLCSASRVGVECRREALSVMCRAGLQSFQACSDDRAILPCGVSVQGLKVTNRISFAQERPTPPLHPATKRRTPRRAIPVPAPASDSCASSILERP